MIGSGKRMGSTTVRNGRCGAVPALMFGCGLAGMLAGCAAPPATGINDPYEAINRKTHAFNKDFDSVVFRKMAHAPVATAISDGPVGTVVSNVSGNLRLPGEVVNSVLQGRRNRRSRTPSVS